MDADAQYGNDGVIASALMAAPIFPVYNADGSYNWDNNGYLRLEENGVGDTQFNETLNPVALALVARLTEAPVLPCSVYWEGKLGFRRKIVIRYGELIPYEAMGLTESSSARELRNATQLLFGKVLESIEVSKNEY